VHGRARDVVGGYIGERAVVGRVDSPGGDNRFHVQLSNFIKHNFTLL